MCGISGVITFDTITDNDVATINSLSQALQHRGPDHSGWYQDQRLIMAHHRLSIIDLSKEANQPMISHDKQWILIFNGEIYNSEALRKELSPKYPFKTQHSDTETLLYCFNEWGISCLNKLNGMFSFAIYHQATKTLYLVRDRLGEKPLFYTQTPQGVYFSSEAQSFFNSKLLTKRLNTDALYHYLTFLSVPPPHSLFKGISKLEAGHYLEIKNTQINKHCYWNIADFLNQPSENSYDEACFKTEQLLKQSMTYRNISDVPICVSLSGGLDSSLNLHYSKMTNDQLQAITLFSENTASFNEQKSAALLAKHYRTHLIEKEISDAIIAHHLRPNIQAKLDMPCGDPVNILLLELCETVSRNNMKVLLVGDGGDELGGYPSYQRIQHKYHLYQCTKPILPILSRMIPKIKRYLHNRSFLPDRHTHGFMEVEKQSACKHKTAANSYDYIASWMSEIRQDQPDSILRQVSNIEYKLRLPELLLARLDQISMLHGIEARAPFMDHQLIEYSATLPFSSKMKSHPKSLLRHIAQHQLPQEVLTHPKTGFGDFMRPFFRRRTSQTLS